MASFIVKNRITEVAGLQAFDEAGYHFNVELSNETEFVFTRPSKITT
jgi:cytoplasmic iron level regulating protein YaaA (DUF328/UPF0246 family)